MRVLAVLLVAALVLCARADGDQEKKGPKITNHVFFDVEIDGKPAGEGAAGTTASHLQGFTEITGTELTPDLGNLQGAS